MQNQRTRLASSGARRRNKSRGGRRKENRDMEGDDGDNDNTGRVGRDGRLVKPMLMEKPSSRDNGFNYYKEDE